MSETIPARFRKTKTDKWAVMAPVADLEKALEAGGKVEVLKKSGDWSTFQVASLGRPFDLDGVEMCYGYGPEDDAEGAKSEGAPGNSTRPSQPRATSLPAEPPRDESEHLPEYQGGPDDEWSEF